MSAAAPAPIESIFSEHIAEYVGMEEDPGPGVDVLGRAEDIPFENDRFDLVLCSQVLEHSDNPAQAVSEIGRVLRPGGVAFVSTHGVIGYHPHPDDYWRWTHAGLEKLFRDEGHWARLDVFPNGGTASTLGSVFCRELYLLLSLEADGVADLPAHLLYLPGELEDRPRVEAPPEPAAESCPKLSCRRRSRLGGTIERTARCSQPQKL